MAAHPTSRAPKPATEQPGNSFKYLYWRLTDKEFQQLCAALLRHKYDNVRCFPVGMADEGIDAIANGDIIYQVKWSSKVEQNPDTWLSGTIDDERKKITRLVREKRISRYILMTSVAGTTTATGAGSIQKLQKDLSKYTAEFGIPVECWWQSDIDAEVDAAPDAIKWSYQEMLAGVEAMRYLIHGSQVDGEAAKMRDTVLHVMASQWRDDSKIKFSQVDVDRINVVDLFVDVQASLQAPPRNAIEQFSSMQNHKAYESLGAVAYMLRTTAPLTYLLGVPGQGKSTLGQYLSQIHRAAILPGDMHGDRKPPHDFIDDPKLPLRVDLKDYAAWISGHDPFGDEDPPKKPRWRKRGQRSLELFLADFCSAHSGGRDVVVEQVQSMLARYPTLLVLDGLDEVADPDLRAIMVEQINLTATRMGAAENVRRFQILVTARPNASGLAEPDEDIFQTLRLEPLSHTLQNEFVNKWCDVNDVHGVDRRKLRRTFHDRTALDHIAQLADNPMQLTILLFLISRKGDAVPVSRTPLYSDYMGTLLDREVNKRQIDREQIPRVVEVTSFLGWHMHAGVEIESNAGRMIVQDIEAALLVYFFRTQGPGREVKDLFKAVTDRFWALTSKVDGTFEFAVQPVREYFAAKFLAEWAGHDRRDALPKQDVLRQLIDRTYWLNTARFYAGFAPPNELAGLRYGLEDALMERRHPLQERVAAWALLGDGIFANNSRVQQDVVRLLIDDLSLRLISDHPEASVNFPRLSRKSGGEDMTFALMRDLASNPDSDLSEARVSILRQHLPLDQKNFAEWWTPQLQAAIGKPEETSWLKIGGNFGVPRLLHAEASRLKLDSPEACQAALHAGASPEEGSGQGKALLRAVLDGWCSDVATSSSSEAGTLLRAMRPQWYHQLNEKSRTGPSAPTEHLWVSDRDRSSRSSAWNALLDLNPQYRALKRAANTRGRGQKGTTEPWQNPAREIARLHGPCWLAAEIAIIGAATQDIIGSGSVDRDGQPFGENVDYGTFVLEVHRHPVSEWWYAMHETYSDSLSHQTWSLALLATASTEIVIEHIGRIDACLSEATDSEFFAIASSASRLGVTQPQRRLEARAMEVAAGLSQRTVLLLSHFVAGLSSLDPLTPLTDSELAALATPQAASWPIARAVTARLLDSPSPTLLDALAALGPLSRVQFPHRAISPGEDVIAAILDSPARYPCSWVMAAERWHSMANEDGALEQVVLEREWVPKVPRG
ncbi:hypothetical protein AB0K40_23405 [Nonomuraea bangladeshensis]|uniref:ATP-binding protein n=1 Tax=Nonomuraea bangladeshensis TaxID=404385 RepID=A0ABV3H7I4_9ACTN